LDLTRVIPVAVPVALAGRTVLVWPLRLADLALLQGWIRQIAAPSPLSAVRAALLSADAAGRARLLRRAYDRAESWPVRYGSAEGGALFNSEAGLLYFLAVALARSTPIEACDPEELVAALDPVEWSELLAAAWGTEPLDELERLLDPDALTPGEDLNWGEAFAETARDTGWTFAQIGELTVSQWIAYRSDGKVARVARTVPEGMTVLQYAEMRRRAFEGLDDDLVEGEVMP
jgi:hypothetical protein